MPCLTWTPAGLLPKLKGTPQKVFASLNSMSNIPNSDTGAVHRNLASEQTLVMREAVRGQSVMSTCGGFDWSARNSAFWSEYAWKRRLLVKGPAGVHGTFAGAASALTGCRGASMERASRIVKPTVCLSFEVKGKLFLGFLSGLLTLKALGG